MRENERECERMGENGREWERMGEGIRGEGQHYTELACCEDFRWICPPEPVEIVFKLPALIWH